MDFDIKTILELGMDLSKETVKLDFYSNLKKATTTVVEDGHAYDGINLILKRYPWVDENWLLNQNRFIGTDKLVAVVRCHEEDEYDEQVGRSEAMKKLNKKILKQKERIFTSFEDYIKAAL